MIRLHQAVACTVLLFPLAAAAQAPAPPLATAPATAQAATPAPLAQIGRAHV